MFGWKKKYDKMVANYNRLHSDFKNLARINEATGQRALGVIEKLQEENEIYKLKVDILETLDDVREGVLLVNELQDQYNERHASGGSSKNACDTSDEGCVMEAGAEGR